MRFSMTLFVRAILTCITFTNCAQKYGKYCGSRLKIKKTKNMKILAHRCSLARAHPTNHYEPPVRSNAILGPSPERLRGNYYGVIGLG